MYRGFSVRKDNIVIDMDHLSFTSKLLLKKEKDHNRIYEYGKTSL